ncbi:hypothetical protein Fot_56925 [Forsythia ovata]|uniref:Transposase n=1 Tax=Forsythia ovata TaxID=205694 RepID=A0ABD1NXI3_9LAMI
MIRLHMLMYGFQHSYRTWIFHGEIYPVVTSNLTSSSDIGYSSDEDQVDPMVNVLHDLVGSKKRANPTEANNFNEEVEEYEDSIEEDENDELNLDDDDSESDAIDNDDNSDNDSE